MRHDIHIVGAVVLALLSCFAHGQERLSTILDRGYVAQWLVCGPFDSDLADGIEAAVRESRSPLGERDYMAPIGGVTRMRPKALMAVEKPDGEAYWEETGRQGPQLDLAPFFRDRQEGVAYAAFYVQADVGQDVLVDLQTVLGARVFVNGFKVRDAGPAPIASAGRDEFVVSFRTGTNLIVFEAPGIDLGALAQAATVAQQSLPSLIRMNRPLLSGSSGYEIALRLRPAVKLGDIYYVPRLEWQGTFSGTDLDLAQDMALTLFNGSDAQRSGSTTVEVALPNGSKPFQYTVPSIAAGMRCDVPVAVPVQGKGAGETAPVQLTLLNGSDRAVFRDEVTVLPPPPAGKAYVLSGMAFSAASTDSEAEAQAQWNSALTAQLLLLEQQPLYGFDFGPVSRWHPWLLANPALRRPAYNAAVSSRCASAAGYTVLDERLVNGELLVRNLAYGQIAAETLVGERGSAYVAWDVSGIAPQSPQLLADTGITGVVTNLKVAGIPPVGRLISLNGASVPFRRKQGAGQAATADGLRKQISRERRELLDMGMPYDLYVYGSAIMPPEPFLLKEASLLAQGVPSVIFSGTAPSQFFGDLQLAVRESEIAIPETGRYLNNGNPGDLLIQDSLKDAHAALSALVLRAETLATRAAVAGAEYPEWTLDAVWRQLLYWGAPDRLGRAQSAQTLVDALTALAQARDMAEHVLVHAADYLAENTNTYADAPVKRADMQAVVVFNPSSWPRTDVCRVEIEPTDGAAFSIIDKKGGAVAFHVEETTVDNGRIRRALVAFVAHDIPSQGYRTYYVVPGSKFPAQIEEKGAAIENEYFKLIVDALHGGSIISLIDKATGKEWATTPLNELLAFKEDKARTDGGRQLWTLGSPDHLNAKPSALRVTRSGPMQRLTIDVPCGSGTVRQVITLWSGVRRVDCRMTLTDVPEDALYALSFPTEGSGRVPVFGERFGATIGRKGVRPFDFRTTADSNPSATGAHPSLRWFALTPGDGLVTDDGGSVPLGPTRIIHGKTEALERAGAALQRVFVRRGIPVTLMPAHPPVRNPVWSDSTEMPNHNDDLSHGTSIRFVIGGPEENVFCRRIFSQLPEDSVPLIEQRMAEGTVFCCLDYDVPEGFPPVPTVVIAGHTETGTLAALKGLSDAIATTGEYSLPPKGYIGRDLPTKASNGLAVVHDRSRLASVEADGTLVLLLRHGEAGALESVEGTTTSTIRYGLIPFEGDWRQADLPREGHSFSEGFVAVATDLHIADLPAERSFLEVSDPDFIVTSLKPAGYNRAAMKSYGIGANDGVVIRGYDAEGAGSGVTLTFPGGLRSARRVTIGESGGEELANDGTRTVFSTSPFEVASVWTLPVTHRGRKGNPTIEYPAASVDPLSTRFWQTSTGAAPPGNGALSLLVSPGETTSGNVAKVVVCNNLVDGPVDGVVALSAPESWHISPTSFRYALKPGESMSQDILVLREPGTEATGGLIAQTAYGDATLVDYAMGADTGLSVTTRRKFDEVHVEVTNRSTVPADGWAALAAPKWSSPMPNREELHIPPFEKARVIFRVVDEPAGDGLVAKVVANDRAVYAPVSPKGQD